MQAGTPTPSYAAPAHREPRAAPPTAARIRCDPVDVADGVLRQAAAPAGDPGVDAAGR